ncbi:MAG: zf-HC2 domain-containing protein [Chloroflexi bacterium]|nr:zf-HC2 domain-containing protein [Chloroflexota bacterium]
MPSLPIFSHRRLRRELLSSYLDGRLTEGEAQKLEEHLQRCPGCTQEMEEVRKTVRLLRALPQVSLPRSFALTPAMLQLVGKPSPFRRYLTLATATSALLLMLTFAGDLAGIAQLEQTPLALQERPAQTEQRAAPPEVTPAPAPFRLTDAGAAQKTQGTEQGPKAVSPKPPPFPWRLLEIALALLTLALSLAWFYIARRSRRTMPKR